MKHALCAALSASLLGGCTGGGSPAPTTPTAPTASQAAASPSTGVVVPTGESSLSGVVSDNGEPVANASVNAWIETGSIGYSYWYAHGPVHSDASGSFRMTNMPAGARVWVQLNKEGFVQPCAASRTVSGDLTLDVSLISAAHSSMSPIASSPGFRSVSGTVVQMTAVGVQPVAGASVSVGTGRGFGPSENPAAYTYSDASGRFALCDLPSNETAYLEVDKGAAAAYANVAPTDTGDIQITLP